MTTLKVQIPPKLIPVFLGEADYRGAYGGRGSGKSWAFAKMAAVRGAMWDQEGRSGVILCIREFMNSLEDSSLQDIKNAIQSDATLSVVYEVGEKYVRSKSGRIRFLFAGTSVNLDSIKSKSKILLVWAEEAENIKADAWEKIVPTVREEGSEIWATWNPESERSWVHKNIRLSSDERTKCVEINHRDNPWFTDKLERMRVKHQEDNPDTYGHVWEGEFKTAFRGAYFVKELAKARADGRVGYVGRHPNMEVRTYWDLGRRDHTAIWVCQFVGGSIRVIDYIEGAGQSPGYYFDQLREKGYKGCHVGLPHDGARVGPDNSSGQSYEDQARAAGFDPEVIPNQGAGAAMLRINAARKVFPDIHFNEETCRTGLRALSAYHEKWDDKRDVGLGPNHDWSSHAADAFGLMCASYEEPRSIHGNGELEVHNYAGW